ncbi:MAG: UDP-N-acetylmuramoyl-L-alanine--D-glutamate ligase [Chloroflexi bacterium]|nr:UDP-N-acetylmuramoyl-L-alanine--D-glutamate ligase [Chloroflexota bacterium]
MDGNLTESAKERLRGFRGRTIGIVGLGREGLDLVRFLCGHGAQITVSDSANAPTLALTLDSLRDLPVRYLLGNQLGSDLMNCDEILVSPGVARSAPVVAEPAAAGIPVSSATRLYFELCPGPVLAVTGSSGKTTTTTLIGRMLRAAGLPTLVGGNIGTPMLAQMESATPSTWSVLELSSFQLEDMTQSPRVGAVLNITPNHLDRHVDMEEYIQAKGNLIRFQREDDVAVLNADDPIVCTLPGHGRAVFFSLQGPVDGTWLEGNQLVAGGRIPALGGTHIDAPGPFLTTTQIPLRGLHNVANVLAASAAALSVGCPVASIAEVVRSFRPVPHRIEIVAEVEGVTYVNDSIATSPERSMAALASFEEPIVLIAGGRDKHLPMEDWARAIGERVRAVVLVGEASGQIRAALKAAAARCPVESAGSFAQVVPMARRLARRGDVVLLSPGCTSFDEFRDYEARGEAFRTAVRELQKDDSIAG